MATPNQVARLQAGAKGGTSGVAAFDQAQAQVAQSRNSAMAALRAQGGGIHAPAALIAQLNSDIASPSATAIGNLAQYGATAAYANQQDEAGTQNYMKEAQAAGPAILAAQDRDLQQKLALLAASRSGGGGGGGSSGGTLSDSELRLRLMGQAQAIREQRAHDIQIGAAGAQHQLAAADIPYRHIIANAAVGQPQRGPGQMNNPDYTPRGSDTQAGAQVQHYQQQVRTYKNVDDDRQRYYDSFKQALSNLQARTYGPGITDEARQLGLAAGVDPGRVYGAITPQLEASYLDANEKLGLYNDTSKQTVTGQTLDAMSAGRVLKLDPTQTEKLASTTDYVWSDPNSRANKAFAAYLKQQNVDAATLTVDDLNTQKTAFIAADSQGQYKENLSQRVVDDAHSAVTQGLDYMTWQQRLMQNPEYQANPHAFQLGFAQAAPLFQYAAALHSRQTEAGGGNFDPTTDPYATTGG